MDTSWLNVLSGLDKMVLGSILGSVILAFLLLIVVFSVKIKSQQDRNAMLRDLLQSCTEETQEQKDALMDHANNAADMQTVAEHYRQEVKQHQTSETSLRKERDNALRLNKELHEVMAQLQAEKQKITQSAEEVHQELLASQKEVQAVLKRNEFWVEQISELRTKHEALKLKLRKREHTS